MTTRPDFDDKAPLIRNRSVALIAAQMAHVDSFGTGPLAALRRLDPNGALAEPTLHRLLARHVSDSALEAIGLPAWALVIHAAALAAPRQVSFPRRDDEPADVADQPRFWAEQSRRAQRGLGETLWGNDSKRPLYSERRFANLLEASGEELGVALPRAVRFVVAAGRRLPILAVADLVASAMGNEDDWARSVRHRIARGYYQAEAKAETATHSTSPSTSLGDTA